MLETQIVCKNKRQICYQEGAKLRGIVPAPHKYFLEYMAMHPTPAQITFNLAFEAQANNECIFQNFLRGTYRHIWKNIIYFSLFSKKYLLDSWQSQEHWHLCPTKLHKEYRSLFPGEMLNYILEYEHASNQEIFLWLQQERQL